MHIPTSTGTTDFRGQPGLSFPLACPNRQVDWFISWDSLDSIEDDNCVIRRSRHSWLVSILPRIPPALPPASLFRHVDQHITEPELLSTQSLGIPLLNLRGYRPIWNHLPRRSVYLISAVILLLARAIPCSYLGSIGTSPAGPVSLRPATYTSWHAISPPQDVVYFRYYIPKLDLGVKRY